MTLTDQSDGWVGEVRIQFVLQIKRRDLWQDYASDYDPEGILKVLKQRKTKQKRLPKQVVEQTYQLRKYTLHNQPNGSYLKWDLIRTRTIRAITNQQP